MLVVKQEEPRQQQVTTSSDSETKKRRNNHRFKPCPSCGTSVSTNGNNFIYHVKRCDDALAELMYPREYKLYSDNIRKLALEKLDKLDTFRFRGVHPGNAFPAFVEVNSAHENGHLITVMTADGTQFSGFIIKEPDAKKQKKNPVLEEYMFGQ